MPQTPTPNRGLPAPALGDTADGPDAVDDLRQALDNIAGIGWDDLANRPTAVSTVGTAIGCPGTFFWAEDTAQLFLSVNASWIDLSGASSPPIPLGASLEYGGAGDPSDSRYLLEDGRELLRAGQYAPLFGVLSTTYGAGNGTTTFNIPDSRGRVTVSPDNMGTAKGAAGRLPNSPSGRGNVGGEERHLLTAAESGIQNHNHGGATGAMSANAVHGHNIEGVNMGGAPPNFGAVAIGSQFSGFGGSSYALQTTNAGSFSFGFYATNVNIDHTHAIGAQSANAASAHNVMQPYVVKNKIIRVR
jgi:microcystin-dependent protein